MEYYICKECGALYNVYMEYCPAADCDYGELIEIDELMIPICKTLLDLNYAVDSSCAGHAYTTSTIPQVHFANWWVDYVGVESLENAFSGLPDGWEIHIHDIKNDGEIIGKHVALVANIDSELIAEDRYMVIIERNLALLDFVKKLEYFDW